MDSKDRRVPTTIVPYPGPALDPDEQDIFVFLRPETNGVLAESTILKVIREANSTNPALKLAYLANYPGDFIVENHIVEQYYSLRLHFAVMGAAPFTESMKELFQSRFGQPFSDQRVIGAFRALDIFGKDPEELFDTWVPDSDVKTIHGQCIKKIQDYYVVNYDVPALIHKNSRHTDIAVMMFRTKIGYDRVRVLVNEMHNALCAANILSPQFDASRAFHYSKGPLEQILDGISYLAADNQTGLTLRSFTYAKWLMDRGVTGPTIAGLLLNPIVSIRGEDGSITEEHILQKTSGKTFEESLRIIETVAETVPMVHRGPILEKLEIV